MPTTSPVSTQRTGSGVLEYAYATDADAHSMRRIMIARGASVSLVAQHPDGTYRFDVL